jgi:hypothetical protein
MDTTSVAYVLCRIEDDSSLTPVSEHEDIVAAVIAGKHQVEVEDFDFSYGLYVDGGRVASFAEGRIGIGSGHTGTVDSATSTAWMTAMTTTSMCLWPNTSYT